MARVCFGAAKVEYTNKTVNFDEFKAMKPSLPLGSVPVLTLPNGRVVCQSGAINRYAASLAKLYGDSPVETLLIDEVVLSAEELLNKCVHEQMWRGREPMCETRLCAVGLKFMPPRASPHSQGAPAAGRGRQEGGAPGLRS